MRAPSASLSVRRLSWLRNSNLSRMSWTLGEYPSKYASKSARSDCWEARAARSRRVNGEVL